jgi:hypothetical protein
VTEPAQAPAAPATDAHSAAFARGAVARPRRLTFLWGRRLPGLWGDVRIDLFAFLFALGMLHHELQFILEQQRIGPIGDYMERWSRVRPSSGWSSEVGLALHLADVAISVLILVLPWRRALLCLLAIPYLLSLLASPERISGHSSLLAAALALVLMLSTAEVVERLGRRRSAWPEGTDWHGWMLAGLTTLCALTYLFAAFHKLNTGWFSRNVGASMLAAFLRPLGLPPAAETLLEAPVTYATPAVELALPFLLLLRRTRLLGCLLGLLFHLPMLTEGVMDFPTVVLAFYPLFLSPEQARQLLGRCLTRPSVPRLAGAVVIGATGIASIRQADHVTTLYTRGAGLEAAVMAAHSVLLYATMLLFAYLTVTLLALLLERPPRRPPVPLPA